MNIAAMRVRITLQRSAVIVDEIGNHKSIWEDYYQCWATASESHGDESEDAAHTDEKDQMNLTIRYCSETKALNSKGYRVILNDQIYNITHINMMGWRRHSVKLTCELVQPHGQEKGVNTP